MRLTERSMLNLATDVRAADILAADIERRRREGLGDARGERSPDPVRAPWSGRLTGLRRLIAGGGHA
jgi:hypothetical protein